MNPTHAVHYGYVPSNIATSVWPSANSSTVVVGTSASNKRSHSVSESDCDDVFSEESSKDRKCRSPGETDSCQMLSRKKRRGVIEKKRRDRINTSLTELKRLVPSAFEKQGSAKLEKAEILQMTVDHLKKIHANSKGLDTLGYDPHKFAMDYHTMGFRECASEVARYLVTIEGMDIQDPLRLRLMSHLQCFAAQRELAIKQSTFPSWGYSPSQNYPSNSPPNHISTQNTLMPDYHHHDISAYSQSPVVQPNNVEASSRSMSLTTLTPVVTTSSAFSYHQSVANSFPNDTSGSSHSNYNQNGGNSAQMKPYRPWGGAEVAY